MGCNCGHKSPCGCKEKAITIETTEPTSCKEKCSEVFLDSCILHNQPDMTVTINGNSFTIKRGERLEQIIQNLVLFLSSGTDYSTAAKEFRIDSYTDSSIEFSWEKQDGYTYSISINDGTEEVLQEVGAVDRYEIINLQEDIDYEFYVLNNETNTKSVTLKFKL